MSAPVDEIDVGHEPRARAPWHDWSGGQRRLAVVAAVAVVLAAGLVWFLVREPGTPPASAPPVAAAPAAPGANVVVDLGPDTSKCPAGVRCAYWKTISNDVEETFRAAFPSAGFIGRQTVVNADTGEVLWDLVRFQTGTLVTVVLTQQPVALLPAPPVVDDTPSDVDRRNGSVLLTAVRDGYLMTATAAGLPGQLLPVPSVQQWLRSVPAP